MLHIIGQYKKLFISCVLSYQVGGNEGLSADVEFAAKTSNVLTIKEYNDLLLKYNDNEKELNAQVASVIENQLYQDYDVVKILEKYSNLSDDVKVESIQKRDNLSKKIDKNLDNSFKKISFNRTLKKGITNGEDIKTLQTYLVQKGLLNPTYTTKNGEVKSSIDGNFGGGTKNALKKVQEKIYGEGNRFVDGEMTKGGKTMSYITNDINDTLSHEQKDVKYGKKANEVIDNLITTEKYVTSFNKVYGGTEHFISRHNGIVGIIHRLGGSDLDNLVDELKDQGLNLDHLDEDKKTELAKELGIDKNSDKFTDGLMRTAIIATVSAIISGGSSVAIELFAINYGENLFKGPEISKIIKQLDQKEVSKYLKKEMREVLLAKDTSVEGLEAILDHLNNENMDPATMMRFINDIYNPNWFQNTFGIFMPEGYEDVENLIEKFKGSNDIDLAKDIVAKIYTLSSDAVNKAKSYRIKKEEEFNSIKEEYENFIKQPAYVLKTDYQELLDKYNYKEYSYSTAKEDEDKAIIGFGSLGDVIGRYTNMLAKKDYIEGKEFDITKARNREMKIDEELDNTNLTKITEKLYSSQSFGYSVDTNKLNDSEYMSALVKKMKAETINGKTSIMSGVIRGVEQHYFGYTETFTAEEFIDAFENTAEKTTSEYILSNLGRDRNQKFQGKITGNLFKITINNKDVFFRDKCTNVVTVVNPIETTVKDTNSIPIVVAVDTGRDNLWKSKGQENGNPPDDVVDPTDDVVDPTDDIVDPTDDIVDLTNEVVTDNFISEPGEEVVGNVNLGGVTTTTGQGSTSSTIGGFSG